MSRLPRRERQRWHPPLYTPDEHRSIQALALGQATELDQQRALRWIIETAAGTYDEPFVPGQTDVRDYLLGRRSVGLAIVKLINTKVEINLK